MTQNLLKKLVSYRPLPNKVLVRRHATETVVGSFGIILAPETRIEKNIRCTVITTGKVAVPGNSGMKIEADVHPGDVVILRQWSGDKIDAEDDQVLNVQYELIEAIDTGCNPDPKAVEYIKQFTEASIMDLNNAG